MNDHQKHAMKLRQTRTHPNFHAYPNAGIIRSQAEAMIRDLHTILECVPEGSDVPPWNVMLISQAAKCINSVERYVSYYGKQKS